MGTGISPKAVGRYGHDIRGFRALKELTANKKYLGVNIGFTISAPYMGTKPYVSPAYSLYCTGRRFKFCRALGEFQEEVLSTSEGAFTKTQGKISALS